MDILKWKFNTKIAILTPKFQNDVKVINQTQISTIQDHSKLIYLSHSSIFLPLRSSQNIKFLGLVHPVPLEVVFLARELSQ